MPGEISTPAPSTIKLEATLVEHGLGVCARPHDAWDSLPGIFPLDDLSKIFERYTYEPESSGEPLDPVTRVSFHRLCVVHAKLDFQFNKPNGISGAENDIRSLVVKNEVGEYVTVLGGIRVFGEPEQGIAKVEINSLPIESPLH